MALGALLSLVDRIDTICSCFSVGLIPSGSKDPFGLRRQGNGLLKILLDHRMSVSLKKLIGAGLAEHTKAAPNISGEIMQFFEGRLRHLCDEMGFSYDSVNAALAAGYDDPLDALERIRALEEIRKEEDLNGVVLYTLHNPVRADLVRDFHDYPYWYCRWDV